MMINNTSIQYDKNSNGFFLHAVTTVLDVQLKSKSPWWLNLNFRFATDSKSFITNSQQCSLFPYFGIVTLSVCRIRGTMEVMEKETAC